MSPDPAFLEYFARAFQRELADAVIPGMPQASWDRRAAWLLYTERRSSGRTTTPPPQAPAPALSGGLFD